MSQVTICELLDTSVCGIHALTVVTVPHPDGLHA